MSSIVAYWLLSAGLERYISNFAGVGQAAFCDLRMQDYGKFGVTDMDDKQKLFRLVKRAASDPNSVMPATRGGGATRRQLSDGTTFSGLEGDVDGGLLDLDIDDGDLLMEAQGGALGQGTSSIKEEPVTQSMFQQPLPPKIRVVVRKRPINKREIERGEDDIIDVDMAQGLLVVHEPKLKVDLQKFTERHKFVFDDALDDGVTNEEVYRSTVQPLVQTLFCGGKATCFAYGQTGSGKTYTMTPLPSMAASDIIQAMNTPDYNDVYLFVSCFEIYGGKVFDLLNARKKLEIREDGKRKVCVVGLKDYMADSLDYIEEISAHAAAARSTGTTGANSDSSRSHSVMQFVVKKGSPGTDGEVVFRKVLGKISFIDLAGSERGADTFDNDRQTRLEGAEINKSLLALKECIRALESDARHVPFRGSKLTGVLRDSFIGENARTVMIANVSPNSSSVEHTLNTLRYADRVKQLKKDKGRRCSTLGLLPSSVSSGPSVRDQNAQPSHYVQQSSRQVNQDPAQASGSQPQSQQFQKGHGNVGRQGSTVEHSRLIDDRPTTTQEEVLSRIPDNYNYREEAAATVDPVILAQHEELMNSILEEEENLIGHHRRVIEGDMDYVREEMEMLADVDQPNSAVDQYANRLEEILKLKVEMMQGLAQRLDNFKQMLKEEEQLSRTIGQRRQRH